MDLLLGVGASGGETFPPGAPANYDSNLLWLASDRNVTKSGSDIISWGDAGNPANYAERSGVGAECTLETNVRNGLPAVRMDNRFMNLICPGLASWSTSGHMFVAAAGLSGSDYLYFLHSADNAQVYVYNRFYWDNGTQQFGASLGWGYTDPLFDSAYRANWAVWEIIWNPTATFYRNGTQLSGGGVVTALMNNAFNRIGGGPDLIGGLDGDFYLVDLALFDAPLTGTDRTEVYDYMAGRIL